MAIRPKHWMNGDIMAWLNVLGASSPHPWSSTSYIFIVQGSNFIPLNVLPLSTRCHHSHSSGRRLAFLSSHPSPITLLFSTSNNKVIDDIPDALSYTKSTSKQILLQLQTALNKQTVSNIPLMRAIVAIATKLDAVVRCDQLMEKPLIKLIIAEPSLLSQAIFITDAVIAAQLAQFVLVDAFDGFDTALVHPCFIASHSYLLDKHIENHDLVYQRLVKVKNHVLDYLTVLRLSSIYADSHFYLNALMRLKEHGHD